VIATARDLSIPTVLIQDGFIPIWRNLGARDLAKRLAATVAWRAGMRVIGAPRPGLGATDYCGVMGNRWRQVVRSRSGRPETVRVIGQPLFDSTISAAARDARAPVDASGKRTVLFIAADFQTGFGDVAAANDQLDDIRILHGLLEQEFGDSFVLKVRPHPREDAAGFRALERLRSTVVEAAVALDDAVLGADLVVSNISSACLVSVAVRIPTMLFTRHFHRGRYRRLFEMYPCVRTSDPDEALRMLRHVDDAFQRAQWLAQNSARSAEYLYVDPTYSASELAVFLLGEAAGSDFSGRLSSARAAIDGLT
jgi:hypothetical protein